MSQHKWLVKHPEVEEAIDLGFYRPIGYAVSRLLRLTPVTPDQVTLAAAVVGVFAGHLFLYGLPLLDVAGGCALVFSALLDSVDGQLARLRATSSGKGRVYDGFSDSAVFISVYVHLAARLVWQGGHPALFLLALLALVSQFTANVMADLYRNSYLRFALLCGGAEGDTPSEVREMRSRARQAGAVERVLLFFYLRIAGQQEALSPRLTALRSAFALPEASDRQPGAGVPDRQAFAARYRELFQPLVPRLAWLGTNVRVLLLLALLPVDAIRTFFWVNVTVLNLALALLVRAHERRARTLLGELRAAEAGEPGR
jgi:phosphatidylglycerophosphate synthase